MKICKIKNCQTPTTPDSARGWCTKHYLRWRRHGDVNLTKTARHGLYGTPTHSSWANMRSRCGSPSNNRFQLYGGRGIKVCEQWADPVHGFNNFLADMGRRPKGMTLDRIDVNGDYSPENCRWATPQVQQFNTRKNHVLGIEQISKNSWRATLTINAKKIHLGCFGSKNEAEDARQEAESRYLPLIFERGTA